MPSARRARIVCMKSRNVSVINMRLRQVANFPSFRSSACVLLVAETGISSREKWQSTSRKWKEVVTRGS